MELGAQIGPKKHGRGHTYGSDDNLCLNMRRPVTSVSGQRVRPEQTSSVVLAGLLHTIVPPTGIVPSILLL